MMPMRHCSGVTTPGQFGPTRRIGAPRSSAFARAMSSAGMPSVMQTARRMPASAASRIASAAPGGGTKMTDASAPVAATASRTVSKTGMPVDRLRRPCPGARRRRPACGTRARASRGTGPCCPRPCTSSRVLLSQRIATASALAPRAAATARSPASRSVSAGVMSSPEPARIARPFGRVRALEPDDERHLHAELLRGRHDALGDQVAAHDAAEDVHEDRPARSRRGGSA